MRRAGGRFRGPGRPSPVDKSKGKTSRPARTAQPTPEPTKPPLTLADLLGSDGRLTVLILGSDAREGVIGHRTDAIIVATIDPGTGKVAMVSLPRDTVNVPIAPGQAYSGRINSLFWEYERATGKTKEALKKTKKALAYAFGTEIDYYAMVDFDGLVRLINSIGGVDVTLTEALIDPTMHLGTKGLRLKAGQRHLDGKKALAFSRSRHSRQRLRPFTTSTAGPRGRRRAGARPGAQGAALAGRAGAQEDRDRPAAARRAGTAGAGLSSQAREPQVHRAGSRPLGPPAARDLHHHSARARGAEDVRPGLQAPAVAGPSVEIHRQRLGPARIVRIRG